MTTVNKKIKAEPTSLKLRRSRRKMRLDKHIEDNPLLYKTFLLSLEIVRLYKYLTKEKHEYVMSKQR